MRYVIVGAGPAGVTAAEALRRIDPKGSITVVGDEPEPPYSRMAIPYLLTGRIEEQGTHLRKAPDYFAEQAIQIVRGRVTRVMPEERAVQLEEGSTMGFDRLLIATGSRPLMPRVPGGDLPGVYPCWTLADARQIAARTSRGRRVVLIGAGFIGSIILEALAMQGAALTVLEMGDRMVPRMMNAQAGNLIRSWCEARGVEVRVSTQVEEIQDLGNDKLRVVMSDGQPIEADLVIAAVGVRPNVEFLQGSGVETRTGVVVDGSLQSSLPGVYAAGDVAEGRDFSTGGYAVHAVQPTAADHARAAALNMAGLTAPFKGSLLMNVLDTLGLISASFGQWMGVEGGETAELLEADSYRYLCLQFDGDVLVGANSLGHTDHLGAVRGLIQGRTSLGVWKDRLLQNPTRIMEAYVARANSYA